MPYGGEKLLLKGERCRGTEMELKLEVLLLWLSGAPELMARWWWLPSNNNSKPERQPDLHISPRCWEIFEILKFKNFNEST